MSEKDWPPTKQWSNAGDKPLVQPDEPLHIEMTHDFDIWSLEASKSIIFKTTTQDPFLDRNSSQTPKQWPPN